MPIHIDSAALNALISIALKGLALMLLAGVVSLALHGAAAATRHLVWALAFGGLLALPVLTVLTPVLPLPVLPARNIHAQSAVSGPSYPPRPAVISPQVTIKPSPEIIARPTLMDSDVFIEDFAYPETPAPGTPAALWILGAWLIVALTLTSPIVVGLRQLALKIAAAEPLDPFMRDRIRALVPEMESHHSVRILCASPGSMPMAAGLRRPVILLPTEAGEWSDAKLRSVLLHEWGHVVRRDCLVQIAARFACALHWFNPLAWIALRRMRLERERACDDFALLAGQKASSYADHLLQIAAESFAPSLPAAVATTMASAGQLETRVRAVLDPRRKRRITKWGAIALGCMVALAVSIPLAAIKLQEMRIFSQMTPEARAEFEKWYSEKVTFPPHALEVEPFSPATVEAVRQFDMVWNELKDGPVGKISGLLAAQAWYLKNHPEDLEGLKNAEDADKRYLEDHRRDFQLGAPLIAAFQTVVARPDYAMEVWSTPTGLRAVDKFDHADYVSIRTAARVIYWSALARLQDGDFEAAMQYAWTLVAVAQVDGHERLVDHMIGEALLGIGIDAWQRISAAIHDAPQRRGIAQTLAQYRVKLPLVFPSENGGREAATIGQIGIVDAARRAGIAADFQNKTGYEIMLESQRVRADFLEQAALPQSANAADAAQLRKDILAMRNSIRSLGEHPSGWRHWIEPYVGPANAATLFSISVPGMVKAGEVTRQRREDYDKLIAAFSKGD